MGGGRLTTEPAGQVDASKDLPRGDRFEEGRLADSVRRATLHQNEWMVKMESQQAAVQCLAMLS